MTLWKLQPSTSAVIKGIDLSIPLEHQNRLKILGFSEGSTVACLRKTPFNGPRLFQINQSVYSLAEDIASAISIA